jgi:hypothetical protein
VLATPPAPPPPYPAPTLTRAYVAHVVAPAPVLARPRPGATRQGTVGTRAAWAGGPVRLLVLTSARDARGRVWLRVRLPDRPNTRSGWIAAGRARVAPTSWRIDVSRRLRTLRVLRAGVVVLRLRAVVGAPATPTPAGLFAVSEVVRQQDPQGFTGSWALHLTAHSDVLDDYGGGPGRVAIHGRAGASLLDPLGTARSHGCVRIDDRRIRWLARHVQAGTPVLVR